MNAPFNAFLDPNYHPTFTYPRLEGWLLLYDTIFLGNPSPYQIDLAAESQQELPVSPESIRRLIDNKYVVPVGRSRFFDSSWRTTRARELEGADGARAAHFRWNDDFDVVVSAHAKHLSDSGLDTAIQEALTLEHREPEAFKLLVSHVAALHAARRLPDKFYTPSEIDKPPDEITRGVIYELAGDIWVRTVLGTHLIAARDHGPMYELLSRLSNSAMSRDQPILMAAEPTIDDLSEDEVRLAGEFAERLARHYTLADVLPEYRKSGLQRQFRAFVTSVLQQLRTDIVDTPTGEILWERFDDRVKAIEAREKQVEWTTPLALSLMAAHPDVQEFCKQSTRRFFIMALLAMVSSPFVKPLLDSAADVVVPSDQWVALITGHAHRR